MSKTSHEFVDRRIKTLPRKTDNLPAYSPTTDTHYENWQDLLQHEAVGFMALVVRPDKPTQPRMMGPYLVESDAVKAKRKLLRRAKAMHPGVKILASVRPLWKDRT